MHERPVEGGHPSEPPYAQHRPTPPSTLPCKVRGPRLLQAEALLTEAVLDACHFRCRSSSLRRASRLRRLWPETCPVGSVALGLWHRSSGLEKHRCEQDRRSGSGGCSSKDSLLACSHVTSEFAIKRGDSDTNIWSEIALSKQRDCAG